MRVVWTAVRAAEWAVWVLWAAGSSDGDGWAGITAAVDAAASRSSRQHASASAEAASAARRFFDGCLDAANTDRDIDFYHWSSQSFGDFWKDALSVLMARERARIGLAASKGDWPRRIAAYARDEQEDAAAYADS